jgi:Na+/H+ antiporter NhaD/arsenite permease-like protein
MVRFWHYRAHSRGRNLLIVGSIANIIVVDQAARLSVRITWRDHARIGIPVTLLTLAIAAIWLGIRASMQ